MIATATRITTRINKATPAVPSPEARPYLVSDRRLTWADVRALNSLRAAAMDAARRHTNDPNELMVAWLSATREGLEVIHGAVGDRF